MTILAAMIAGTFLLQLTAPDGLVVEINPAGIVSLRTPRHTEHFAPGTRCIISTSDGKFILVREPCGAVAEQVRRGDHRSNHD